MLSCKNLNDNVGFQTQDDLQFNSEICSTKEESPEGSNGNFITWDI